MNPPHRNATRRALQAGPATGPYKRPGLQAPTSVGKPPFSPGDSKRDESENENLALPHERDESITDVSALPPPDPLMVQAKKDIDSGQVDTDLHNMPGMDAVRRAELLGGKDKPRQG